MAYLNNLDQQAFKATDDVYQTLSDLGFEIPGVNDPLRMEREGFVKQVRAAEETAIRYAEERQLLPHLISYKAGGPVLDAFIKDRSHEAYCHGPFGSGKTYGALIRILSMQIEMPVSFNTQSKKAPGGVRESRVIGVRNTFNDLQRTLLPDQLAIMPSNVAPIQVGNRIVQSIKFYLPDDTLVHSEFEFLPMDRDDAANKLLGAQTTYFYFNEVRALKWDLIQTAKGRAGRYPGEQRAPSYHFGVVGDTNAPSEESEYYHRREKENPDPALYWRVVGKYANGGDVVRWLAKPNPMSPRSAANFRGNPARKDSNDMAFFRQPGGALFDEITGGFTLNPQAENIDNLPPGYYDRLLTNKVEWVLREVCNRYGSHNVGRRVHTFYSQFTHRSPDITLRPRVLANRAIVIGYDPGKTGTAAIIGQEFGGGIEIFDEYVREGVTAATFVPDLVGHLASKWGAKPSDVKMVYGDMAGDRGNMATDATAFSIWSSHGFKIVPAGTNDLVMRRVALEGPLKHNREDRKPMFQISSRCVKLHTALNGGFQYPLISNSEKREGITRYGETPIKNLYADVAEAAEYLMHGLGFGYRFIGMLTGKVPEHGRQSDDELQETFYRGY